MVQYQHNDRILYGFFYTSWKNTHYSSNNQTNTKIREIKKEFTIQVNADSLSKAAGCLVGYCNNPLIA